MPTPFERRITDLVGRVYDGVFVADAWDDVLERLRVELRARSGVLYQRDLANKRAGMFLSSRLDPWLVQAHDERFLSVDPWGAYIRTRPVGEIVLTHEFFPDDRLERSVFYNDYLKAYGVQYATGGFVYRDGDEVVQIGFQRSKRDGAFPQEVRRVLGMVFPHLQRAITLAGRIPAARHAESTAFRIADSAGVGVVLLDGRGRVIGVNGIAERALHRASIRCDRNGWHAGIATIPVALQTAVERALTSEIGSDVFVSEDAGSEDLQITVLPVQSETQLWGFRASRVRAVLLLRARAALQPPSHETLIRRFGLTPAESRLAVALARGDSVSQAAARSGVSVLTTRSQLRAVFQKTGVHRQAQLVRILLALSRNGDPAR